jgi:hypothetical protein
MADQPTRTHAASEGAEVGQLGLDPDLLADACFTLSVPLSLSSVLSLLSFLNSLSPPSCPISAPQWPTVPGSLSMALLLHRWTLLPTAAFSRGL